MMKIKPPMGKLSNDDFPEGMENYDHLRLRHALRDAHFKYTYPENFPRKIAKSIEEVLVRVYKEYTGDDLTWKEIELYDTPPRNDERPF